MKVLVTMAGRGSRFKDIGVNKPKHEISVKGKPMFDWAMQSLHAFFDQEFVFVTQDEHNTSDFLENACDRLGISQYQEKKLENYTNGQAQTALAADEFLDPDDVVAIYNIDTYIEEGQLISGKIGGDGFIPVFTAPGERWSFAKTDDNSHVTEVSEKEKISDLATAGFYYFDCWSDLTEAYENSAKEVEREYGETYVAPLYNYLIEEGKDVLAYEIDRDAVHVLGTPKDLREFDSSFDPQNQ